MHEKTGIKQFLEWSNGVSAFPKQISTLNREKLINNWQTGMRNSFLEKVPHNSDLIYLYGVVKMSWHKKRHKVVSEEIVQLKIDNP